MMKSLSADVHFGHARAPSRIGDYARSFAGSLLVFCGFMTGALGVCVLVSLARML